MGGDAPETGQTRASGGPEGRPGNQAPRPSESTRNHGNRQPRHIENATEKTAENTAASLRRDPRGRAKTKRRRTEKIGTEITIALKRLSGIKTARLIVDECPPDPRAGGSAMTTIVAWRRDHRISDTEIYGTKQEFRENVLDRMERNRTRRRPRPVRVYEHESRGMIRDLMDAGNNNPGVIRPVHMYDHGGVLLNTEGPHDHWDSRHLEIWPESGVGRPAAILGVNKHSEG